jgi:hypothetical protein
VGALWVTVCDWPLPAAPPVWVWVTLWLVLLVLSDEEDELFELVWEALLDDESPQSSARAAST